MSNVNYSGIATLSLDGEVVATIKNRGTRELGVLITKALAGYNISTEVPKFFNIQINETTDSDGNPVWVNLLNRNLPFTGITYTVADELTKTNYIGDLSLKCIGDLSLNCIIMSTDKLTPSVSENAKLRLCILNSLGTILAEIIEDNTLTKLFNDIVEGTDCIVNWDMSFYNSPDTVETDRSYIR